MKRSDGGSSDGAFKETASGENKNADQTMPLVDKERIPNPLISHLESSVSLDNENWFKINPVKYARDGIIEIDPTIEGSATKQQEFLNAPQESILFKTHEIPFVRPIDTIPLPLITSRDRTSIIAFIEQAPPRTILALLEANKYVVNEILLPAVREENTPMINNLLGRCSSGQRKILLAENPNLLHEASGKDTPAMLTLLLDGIDRNDAKGLLAQQNPSGATPLHIAAEKGNTRTADYLLKKGADPTARVNASYLSKGKTPAGIAKANGHRDLERTLREAKASPDGDSWVGKVAGEKVASSVGGADSKTRR